MGLRTLVIGHKTFLPFEFLSYPRGRILSLWVQVQDIGHKIYDIPSLWNSELSERRNSKFQKLSSSNGGGGDMGGSCFIALSIQDLSLIFWVVREEFLPLRSSVVVGWGVVVGVACLIIVSLQVLSFESLNGNFEIGLWPDLELDNSTSQPNFVWKPKVLCHF